MNPNQVLNAELIDIVFEDRNKAYGAYELRTNYQKRIGRAMLIAFALSGAMLAAATYAPEKNGEAPQERDVLQLRAVTEDLPPTPPPVVPPAAAPQVKSVANTTIKIVPNELAEDIPPTVEDLNTSKTGLLTVDGTEDPTLSVPAAAVESGLSKGIIEVRAKEVEPASVVDVQAAFNGNWVRFLTNNLRANTPLDNGLTAGRYSVTVEFVVDVDGSVSNIRALTAAGYGMEEEAVRVIRKSAKWTPAVINGYPVKAYRKQVIVFDISEN